MGVCSAPCIKFSIVSGLQVNMEGAGKETQDAQQTEEEVTEMQTNKQFGQG